MAQDLRGVVIDELTPRHGQRHQRGGRQVLCQGLRTGALLDQPRGFQVACCHSLVTSWLL